MRSQASRPTENCICLCTAQYAHRRDGDGPGDFLCFSQVLHSSCAGTCRKEVEVRTAFLKLHQNHTRGHWGEHKKNLRRHLEDGLESGHAEGGTLPVPQTRTRGWTLSLQQCRWNPCPLPGVSTKPQTFQAFESIYRNLCCLQWPPPQRSARRPRQHPSKLPGVSGQRSGRVGPKAPCQMHGL